MLQSLIVALIVAAALLYSGWIFMPAALRRASAARVARLASRFGLGEHSSQRLRSRLEKTSACSECAQCKGCSSSKLPTRAAPPDNGN